MTAAETGARRIQIVDTLRGIAALSVAWFHFTNGGHLLRPGWLKSSGSFGWLGVDVFFVISGFIIPYTMYHGGYRLTRDIGTFILKRVVRLDPPYIATIVVTIGLGYLSTLVPGFRGDALSISAPQVLSHLAYLNAFLGYAWLSPVFWSLAIEFQYYLLIALALPVLTHRHLGVRVAAVLTACALSVVWPPTDNLVFHYLGLFAMGIVTFHWRSGLVPAGIAVPLLAIAATATGLALGAYIAAVGLATAGLIRFLRVRNAGPLTFLGAISYSIYLLHVPIGGRVINLGSRFTPSWATDVVTLAAAVAASMAAAYGMYLLVERPAQRWSSSFKYAVRPRVSP